MQNKLTTKHPLLDEQGHLLEAGWANEVILQYNPEMVRRGGMSLKEWEYYLVLTREFALALSLVGAGPGRQATVHFIDFCENHAVCETRSFLAEHAGFSMPDTIFRDIHCTAENSDVSFSYEEGLCRLKVDWKGLNGGSDFFADVTLTLPKQDLMTVVVPYADPELFYYNCKANCLPATGEMRYGEKIYCFAPEKTVGTYDWGRGIWEPVNQWYWGSASGMHNGKPFGFNIGHGFGDVSKGTENMIFYDGVCHKLAEITFRIPGDVIGDLRLTLPDENYLKPWDIVSSDGRLDLVFTPVLDRTSLQQSGEYFAGQHQVFGNFSGTAILDDGTKLPIENLFGFAEKVGNVWG